MTGNGTGSPDNTMRRVFQRIFDFYWGQGIADDVPALTYYLLLSLAPLALGLAAIQALLLKNVLSAIEVADQLNRFLPNAVHGDITRLVLGTRSNSPQLLAAAFKFSGGEHPVYFIYGFKRGAYWPFVPKGDGKERDNSEELELKAKLEKELPIEQDLTRWLALFDAPI